MSEHLGYKGEYAAFLTLYKFTTDLNSYRNGKPCKADKLSGGEVEILSNILRLLAQAVDAAGRRKLIEALKKEG